MARIEWVRLRLENWALWKSREQGGGLGFYSQSSFLNEAATDRYRQAHIPVDEVDAAVTDQAVTAMHAARDHLHAVLWSMYVKGSGIKETSRRLGKNESTVHANLAQADAWLAEWFRARAERQRAARVAQRGFTA